MSSEVLKACERCGGNDQVVNGCQLENGQSWSVQCACGHQSPFKGSSEEAITAWNTRTPTVATDEGVVELEAALSDDECTICGKARWQHSTNCGVGMCQIYPIFRSRKAAFSALVEQARAAIAAQVTE